MKNAFNRLAYADKRRFYSDLEAEMRAMFGSIWFTNLANASAMLFHQIPDLNWAGFYLNTGDRLELSSFQGLPACLSIPFNKGVCGAAATRRTSVLVDDVEKFPGHIACDSRSRSELVVPLLKGTRLIGVMDLDSPLVARFDSDDLLGLEAIATTLVTSCEWPDGYF